MSGQREANQIFVCRINGQLEIGGSFAHPAPPRLVKRILNPQGHPFEPLISLHNRANVIRSIFDLEWACQLQRRWTGNTAPLEMHCTP